MGQQEVINTLKKAKKPLSTKEIAERINANRNRVSLSLAKLKKYNEVKYFRVKRFNHYEWHYFL